MSNGLQERIDAMFSWDRAIAWFSVLMLWMAIGFVVYAINQFVPSSGVRIALITGAGLVLIFNSASIGAMLRHYKEDKNHIYGQDIHHLDEGRRRAGH